MRKLPLPSVIIGSLVGAVAIHLGMVACSDSTRPAQAADCASYQVAGFYKGNLVASPGGQIPEGLSPTVNLPAGWEPIAGSPYAGSSTMVGAMVIVRRCTP